ncbi:hypothetical protein [Roseisalinus antarcticus]|nr:hypothetical protein [Roseisalinus antarcticus]
MVDTRPTADAAAIVRDPRPDIPLPIPPGQGQTAATLSASLVGAAHDSARAEADRKVTSVAPIERTLKPYGVAMLPDEAARRAAADQAREAARAAQQATVAEAQAKRDTQSAEVAQRDAEQAEAVVTAKVAQAEADRTAGAGDGAVDDASKEAAAQSMPVESVTDQQAAS